MDAINTWTPWAKCIYFPCENLSGYLCISLLPPISLDCLNIAATLVQLIINLAGPSSPSTFLPPHPSPPHPTFSYFTEQWSFKIVCPTMPGFCWKPPMVFYDRIKCRHSTWCSETCWAGPCLPFQPMPPAGLLSMMLPSPKSHSVLWVSHTIFHPQCFVLAIPSAQNIPSTFLHMTGLYHLCLHSCIKLMFPQRRLSTFLTKAALSSLSHWFYFIHDPSP